MEITKEMLDAPAFGKGSEGYQDDTVEIVPATESLPKREEKGTAETIPAEDDVDQKVPYSRFKKTLDARIEAENNAREAQERYEKLLNDREVEQQRNQYNPVSQETSEAYRGSLPSHWVKLYGDSPESREAYSYELQRQAEIEERAERRALEAVRNERDQETRILQENESVIDNRIEDLSGRLGRDLSEAEESALLDIVDEYTPKDREGNYAGDTIPFEKAWEILEMKRSQQSTSSRRARTIPTALTGSRTEGEPSADRNQSNDFNPRDWNAYKRRL